MAPPPNAFSNELGEWVCREFRESVVFVELMPKDPAKVYERWNAIDKIPSDDTKRILEREKESQESQCSTGSIIKDANGHIWILTCAHVMGPAFNATRPITANQVEQLFQARILCDHREQRFKVREDLARIYCKAHVAQISCAKDLILLSVPRGQFANYCNQSHRILSIAPNPPSPLQRVAMLSWPPNRHRTSVSGEASHPGRLISSVSVGNPFGYSMRLAEVNITSEKGSSSALLLNGSGEYVAALHGGCGTGFSYFICFRDLRDTLREWGMVE